MKAQEIQEIFNLLKTISKSVYGYDTKSFSSEMSFTDDEIPSQESPAETHAQSLETVAGKIKNCTRCPLASGRHNTVPGEGVSNPLVLVVGEGPGEDEDLSGRPFVGKAGQLLDKELASIQLSRNKNCYIANIVKCRPPANRTPYPQEADSCISFLDAQISILKPKMILAAGSTAAKNLLKTSDGVTKLRGRCFEYKGIPLIVTYHPSALLRDETLKRPAWEDLKFFKSRLLQIAPDYDR
ncbi:MAG: uracil-DNA glycosylase [Treponema sp.]|nr:uracil-DNA glycosylase [Treponema sp.]